MDTEISSVHEFKDYCICSDWDGDGEIYNRDNKVVWRFRSTGLNETSKKGERGPKCVFVLFDGDGKKLAEISREKLFPKARYNVYEKGSFRCMIHQRSLLFTRYEFKFESGLKWDLHLPMFTVFGKGSSQNGSQVLVRLKTRMQWYLRISTGCDGADMMAALAFITRKKIQKT